MKKWQLALNKFLADWKKKDYVLGAILTGSYATGLANKYSDIDVQIIFSNKYKWRERGNVKVDGFLIEYFANPICQFEKYLQQNFRLNIKTDANMYKTGKILFDKDGSVKKLRNKGLRYYSKEFAAPKKYALEMMKYTIWDYLDNLKSLASEKSDNFNLSYYILLDKVLNNYGKFLRVQVLPNAKIVRLFTDSKFRRAYGISGFPDKVFIKLFLDCLLFKSQKQGLEKIQKLANYALKKMGGFNINDWKLKRPIEI